jgi:hypothetical protein
MKAKMRLALVVAVVAGLSGYAWRHAGAQDDVLLPVNQATAE